MTWYRMSGSSKGELHGASVLVTVDGEITSGDTVTLTKTGYSQTKTLSDVKTALFTDILDSGTYTATYKTFSNTVSVSAQDVLDKTTKNVTVATSTTITLTIEGAKEDNIKIYDSANTQVGSCVFASGQTTGTVDLEIPPTGGTYKFESTVAKDTETGTSNYSKNVSLTNTSSSVKVMPDNSLYWYGNEVVDYTATYYEGNGNAVKNNDNIFISTNNEAYGNAIAITTNLVSLSGFNKVCCIIKSQLSSVSNALSRFGVCDSIPTDSTVQIYTKYVDSSSSGLLKKEVDISTVNDSLYVKNCVRCSTTQTTATQNVYAVWLE